MSSLKRGLLLILASQLAVGLAWAGDFKQRLAPEIEAIAAQMIEWRRDIHQNPELSNREFRTSALVAEHLESLGMEVRTGIAHTGVVGLLHGSRPGPVIALRADMDALPVTEQTGLPFASTVRGEYDGREVGVMHACGHDAHTAILMATASVLAGHRDQLAGTVMFVFQPAEEGPPPGEEGGAKLMIEEGVFDDPRPDAIFGLHVWPMPPGQLAVKPDGIMAAADGFEIMVRGEQTHGSSPWRGVDPITVAAQIIQGVQMIPARQLDVTDAPAVISFGQVEGGLRWNIIPDEVKLVGTVRTFDPDMREDLLARMEHTASRIAEASGASATLKVDNYAAVTWNDADLLEHNRASLAWAAGDAGLHSTKPITAAEDFSFFQQEIPGVYFFLGIAPEGVPIDHVPANHSPYFDVNEDALITGVRAFVALVGDNLAVAER